MMRVVLAVVLAAGLALLALIDMPSARGLGSHAVRIDVDGGHGSGSYLGHGLVLTAAHVVTTQREVRVDGLVGEVLWASPRYDVALVHVPGDLSATVVALSCRLPRVGERITVSGFPGEFGHVTTAGIVSSVERMYDVDTWREHVLVDAVINGGVSGAGVINANGDVVGMAVGGFGRSLQLGFGPALFIPSGMNVIIPSSTICRLMGRR